MNNRSKQRIVHTGFTLVELLVTIALASVLMALAAPSFSTFQRNAEMTSYVNTLVAAANTARGEAMKRGRYAMVVPMDGQNWESGWHVFVDMNRTQAFEPADGDLLVLSREAAPNYLTISASPGTSASEKAPYLMFDASGYLTSKNGGFSPLTFSVQRNDVSDTEKNEQTRRLIIASTGRIRTCKPAAGDSTCPATATE